MASAFMKPHTDGGGRRVYGYRKQPSTIPLGIDMQRHGYHRGICHLTIGPRGAIKCNVRTFWSNGRLQTWKRDPERYRLPLKNGWNVYGELTDQSLDYHVEQDCPVLNAWDLAWRELHRPHGTMQTRRAHVVAMLDKMWEA